MEIFEEDSANKYLMTFNNSNYYMKKKHYVQKIFRDSINKIIKLPNKKRRQPKEKYSMTEKEEINYIQEQKSHNFEDYIIQRLAFLFGCRICELASLKIKNLNFLNPNEINSTITFSPFKSRATRTEFIPEDLVNDLKEFLKENGEISDSETFVFKAGQSSNCLKRSNTLRQRMKYRLKKSQVLNDKKNLSSIVYRVTKANQTIKQVYKKAIEKVREEIGHARDSSSVNYYINPNLLSKSKYKLKQSLLEIGNKNLRRCLVCCQLDNSVIECEVCSDPFHMSCLIVSSEEDQYKCIGCRNLNKGLKICLKCNKVFEENYPLCSDCNVTISSIAQETYEKYFGVIGDQQINNKKVKNASLTISSNSIRQNEIYKYSLAKALIIKGISFNDELKMNPECYFYWTQSTEKVQKINAPNLEVFNSFKKFSKFGVNIPVEVKWHDIQGFIVVATSDIKINTIISEYTGELRMAREVLFSKDDSLMKLTNGSSSYSSVVISPCNIGNVSRFISGINNTKVKSGNCSSYRFKINSETHILIYSKRKIKKGDILNYDYNKNGNDYDTSKFLDN